MNFDANGAMLTTTILDYSIMAMYEKGLNPTEIILSPKQREQIQKISGSKIKKLDDYIFHTTLSFKDDSNLDDDKIIITDGQNDFTIFGLF